MNSTENSVMETTRKQASQCAVISSEGTYEGKQGLNYMPGISNENVGARGICMHLVTIPPGGRAKVHLHENHETAIYILSGEVDVLYGEGLQECRIARAGDFVYIPAGTPHLPINRSQSEPCATVLARTDPHEQESVVLLPELEVSCFDCLNGVKHQISNGNPCPSVYGITCRLDGSVRHDTEYINSQT